VRSRVKAKTLGTRWIKERLRGSLKE